MNTIRRAGLCILLVAGLLGKGARAADLNSGLLFHLPLRTDLRDHSPRQLAVGVTNQVEIRDGAAWFSGRESWLELPHVALNRRPFSFSFWLKLTGQHPMYGLIEQKDEGEENSWLHVMLRGGRQPYLGFYLDDAISPLPIGAGEWAHLVFQFNGTHQLIWINGQLVCARRSEPYAGNRGTTRIGKSPRWNNVPSRDLEGYLREVRGYDRLLSAEEIARLATADGDMGTVRSLVPRPALLPAAADGVLRESTAVAADVGVPFLSIEGSKLIVTGEAKQVYEVQVSEDLLGNWQPLVVLTNRNGQVSYTDGAARQASGRFYRIKLK